MTGEFLGPVLSSTEFLLPYITFNKPLVIEDVDYDCDVHHENRNNDFDNKHVLIFDDA